MKEEAGEKYLWGKRGLAGAHPLTQQPLGGRLTHWHVLCSNSRYSSAVLFSLFAATGCFLESPCNVFSYMLKSKRFPAKHYWSYCFPKLGVYLVVKEPIVKQFVIWWDIGAKILLRYGPLPLLS